MVYRRGPESMSASAEEQHWAQTSSVVIHHHMRPLAISGAGGHATGVRFANADGSEALLQADTVLRAIGQKFDAALLASSGLAVEAGRVHADADGRTGVPRLYAGGDCRVGGRDLTVQAVEDGKRAAAAIHADLTSKLSV